MENHVEKLKKRAQEISKTKHELKRQTKINLNDLSVAAELFNIPFADDLVRSEIDSLSKTVYTERGLIDRSVTENQEDIDETLNETDDYIRGLEDNIRKLKQMENTTDLVKTSQQIKETEARIDKLEGIKRILDADTKTIRSSAADSSAGNVTSLDFPYNDSYSEKSYSDINEIEALNNFPIYEKMETGTASPGDNKYNNGMYPESLGGVKRSAPMTHYEANQNMPNPNFGKKGFGTKGYKTNCQSCVVVFEARLRGYEVQTLPNTRGSKLRELSYQTNLAWIDPLTGTYPEYINYEDSDDVVQFYEFLDKTIEENCRYTLEFYYNGRKKTGHIVSIDKDEDGVLRLYDPQSGVTLSGKEIGIAIGRMNLAENPASKNNNGRPQILRVDNQLFNQEIVDDILERGKR